MRCVTLLDSIACTRALSRARARSFVFCSLSGERVPLGLLFIADSISAGFPRKETTADAPSRVFDRGKVEDKSKTSFPLPEFRCQH